MTPRSRGAATPDAVGLGETAGDRARVWPWVVVGMIVVVTAAARVRLLDIPLDRDEGEYAYVGQLLLAGVPPFAAAYTMKMPGIHALYALILAVLGETPAAIHTGLVIASAGSTVLVFLLARRLFDAAVGLAAAVAFAALAISPEVFGLASYAEPFALVPVLAGALLLLKAIDERRTPLVLVAGALFGLAVLVKQSAAPFTGFAVVVVVLDRVSARPVAWRRVLLGVVAVVAGALGPVALLCFALGAAGTLDGFWFWTVRYASTYASATSLAKGVGNLVRTLRDVGPPAALIGLAAAVGAATLIRDRRRRPRAAFVTVFVLGSAVALSTGLYFRHQYFILAIPAVALLAGLAPEAAAHAFRGAPRAGLAATVAVVIVPAAFVIWSERYVLLTATPTEAARALYGRNPFPEARVIADYLQARTAPTDTIAVFGSEPEIYFYAGRRAATGFIYMYPLMEHHRFARPMQELLIRQVEHARPKFAVYVHVDASWLFQPDSERTLSRWLGGYWRDFERVGVVDIVSPAVTRYVWGDAARTYAPESERWLAVFRRRERTE